MVVPGMMNMAEVMAESGYTEEDVFDCGISGQIVFLVVVPLVGACRVPVEALSHFMAGADDYAAEGMPEHWSGALSGKWTIKRDRLRILDQSWTAFSDECDKLAEALQQSDYQKTPEFQAEYASAWENLGHIDELDRDIQTWEATSATDIQQLDRKEQKIAALREKRAALHKSVFPGDSQQRTIEPQATTPSPAPVTTAKRSKKKPSIETVALDYMRAEFKQGQFQSAAKFHKHLKTTAGLTDSPFEMGTGVNARKLFCPAASSFFDEGTLGKIWAKIRGV